MLRLRLIVPPDLTPAVMAHVRDDPGVAHLVEVPGGGVVPPGDVIECDVVREAANDLVEWLQDLGVHHRGAIVVDEIATVVSDAAARAEALAPGHGTDSMVWEAVEARAREDAELTVSFLVFIAIAAVIAAVGILLDSPILIVGAMVVGPEYGPLSALCAAAVRKRFRSATVAVTTLSVGLAVAAATALVATTLFRLTGIAGSDYDVGSRQLTAFISHPDGLAAVVAVLAGIVGMLALTEERSGALIGVLVSVTTIPAVSNVGVATAYRAWSQVGGAALQLGVNLAGLLLAGIATLAVQGRLTARSAPALPPRLRRPGRPAA